MMAGRNPVADTPTMQRLDALIRETETWREFHRQQWRRGVRSAAVEALACNIRLKALRDARDAVIHQE